MAIGDSGGVTTTGINPGGGGGFSSSLSNFANSTGGKLAASAAMGALSGAVGQQGQELESFRGTGPLRDPFDLLAHGITGKARLGEALTKRAEKGTQLGPAAIVQSPQFFHGGDLPFPIGVSGQDVGFAQRNDFKPKHGGLGGPFPHFGGDFEPAPSRDETGFEGKFNYFRDLGMAPPEEDTDTGSTTTTTTDQGTRLMAPAKPPIASGFGTQGAQFGQNQTQRRSGVQIGGGPRQAEFMRMLKLAAGQPEGQQ